MRKILLVLLNIALCFTISYADVATKNVIMQDEGTTVAGSGRILNFTGAGVVVTFAGGKYVITIAGGAGSEATTVSDTATLDLTLTGVDIKGDVLEAGIEAILDLQDLQGAVTDAQVPDNITITEADPIAKLTIIPYTFKSLGGNLILNIACTKAMPAGGIITAWKVIGDSQSSIEFQVLKSTVAVPDVESFAEISGTSDPALSNAYQAQDTNLSEWSNATVARGDRIRVQIMSNTSTNPNDRVQILLYLTKSK